MEKCFHKKRLYAYNFDKDKELLIYRKACHKKLSKREDKIIKGYEFKSYAEWSRYIEMKYENVSLNSMRNFRRYLNYEMRNSRYMLNAYGSVLIPLFALIIGELLDKIGVDPIFSIGFNVIALLAFAYQFMCEYAKDAKYVLLYEDYIEIIDRMIELKEQEEARS